MLGRTPAVEPPFLAAPLEHSALSVNSQDLQDRIRLNADQCVKCGFCLPHCPTYRLRADEAESPRGRVALAEGLAESRLTPSKRLDAHLWSCLECRACEPVCPSLVAVGSIMDDVRALRREQSTGIARRWVLAWLDRLSSAAGADRAALLARAYQKSGLARLAEATGITRHPRLSAFHRVALELRQPARLNEEKPAKSGAPRGVDLFIGCVARTAQPGALAAAQQLLTRLGLEVRVPRGQACCGALHRHNGFPRQADQLLTRNAAVLAERPVVGIASACVAELRTHTALAGVHDICRLLAALEWPADLRLRPLRKAVAVHEPCSQRNVLRDPSAAYDLLTRIPGISVVGLEDNAYCCGAAGSYLLQQPKAAQALLAPKVRAMRALGTDILVTTNTGCALHLAAGAHEAGLSLEVLHPVELVVRQLDS
jgi:glycolate oxidase iron-sulfur subunit